MKLILFEYLCKTCGLIFKAPQINPHAYGEFLLRKKNSPALRYLDATSSAAYSEVAEDLWTNSKTNSFDEVTQSDILQSIFGAVACDPDGDGQPFEIGLLPYCSACNEDSNLSWKITEPIKFVEIDVPPVEFIEWRKLTAQEKKLRIDLHLTKIFKSGNPRITGNSSGQLKI